MSGKSAVVGRCAFRLMPGDDLVEGPSSASFSAVGEALALTYTWEHPEDGPQTGTVMASAPDEQGRVEGALFDTWHQQPGLMRLIGDRTGTLVRLHGVYAEEWGWDIDIDHAPGRWSMTMRNVVPESALDSLPAEAPPMTAGPYDVMVARWRER